MILSCFNGKKSSFFASITLNVEQTNVSVNFQISFFSSVAAIEENMLRYLRRPRIRKLLEKNLD